MATIEAIPGGNNLLDPLLYYPLGRGEYLDSDGRRHTFGVRCINTSCPTAQGAGSDGRIRPLRDRLEDVGPSQARRQTVIEEVAECIPYLAEHFRGYLYFENPSVPWAPFRGQPVTVSTRRSEQDERNHIDVEYRIEAGGDVVTVFLRDPMI